MTRSRPQDMELNRRLAEFVWKNATRDHDMFSAEWFTEIHVQKIQHTVEHGYPNCYPSFRVYFDSLWSDLPTWPDHNHKYTKILQNLLKDQRIHEAANSIEEFNILDDYREELNRVTGTYN